MWSSYIWPGITHAVGAVAIQTAVAGIYAWYYNTHWLVPEYWWWGALLGGGFWTLREVFTCIDAGHVQNRTPFDVLTAVIPVIAVAIVVGYV